MQCKWAWSEVHTGLLRSDLAAVGVWVKAVLLWDVQAEVGAGPQDAQQPLPRLLTLSRPEAGTPLQEEGEGGGGGRVYVQLHRCTNTEFKGEEGVLGRKGQDNGQRGRGRNVYVLLHHGTYKTLVYICKGEEGVWYWEGRDSDRNAYVLFQWHIQDFNR